MHEFLEKKWGPLNEYQKGAAVFTWGPIHFHIISETCSILLYNTPGVAMAISYYTKDTWQRILTFC